METIKLKVVIEREGESLCEVNAVDWNESQNTKAHQFTIKCRKTNLR